MIRNWNVAFLKKKAAPLGFVLIRESKLDDLLKLQDQIDSRDDKIDEMDTTIGMMRIMDGEMAFELNVWRKLVSELIKL